jgi:hypothetical protein
MGVGGWLRDGGESGEGGMKGWRGEGEKVKGDERVGVAGFGVFHDAEAGQTWVRKAVWERRNEGEESTWRSETGNLEIDGGVHFLRVRVSMEILVRIVDWVLELPHIGLVEPQESYLFSSGTPPHSIVIWEDLFLVDPTPLTPNRM